MYSTEMEPSIKRTNSECNYSWHDGRDCSSIDPNCSVYLKILGYAEKFLVPHYPRNHKLKRARRLF
jgi:hypothetical protein